MIDQVYKGAGAIGTPIAKKVVSKEVTHITVRKSTAFHENDLVTVTVRDGRGQKRIIPRLSAPILASKSNVEGGLSMAAQVAEALDAGASGAGYAMTIEIGRVNAFNGTILDIEFVPGDVCNIDISVKRVGHGTDHFLVYNYGNDLNTVYPDCESLFVIAGEDITHQTDVDISLKDAYGEDTASIGAYWADTAIFGQQEVDVEERFVRVYQNDDEVQSDVEMKLSGSDSSVCAILHVQHVVDLERVDMNTERKANLIVQKLSTIERKDATRAKALRHSGKAVKSVDVQNVYRDVVYKGK